MANPISAAIDAERPSRNLGYWLARYQGPFGLGIVIAYLIYFLVLNPHPGFPKSMDYTSWLAAGKMAVEGKSARIYDLFRIF